MKTLQVVITLCLVPVVGLLAWGWDWRQVMAFYWLGNVSAGILAVIGMIHSRSVANVTFGDVRLSDIVPPRAFRVISIVFFVVHYGIFTAVHGVLLYEFLSGQLTPDVVDQSGFQFGQVVLPWLVTTGLSVAIKLKRPTTSDSMESIRRATYRRMIVLHLSIIFGAAFIIVLQLPTYAALLLVGLSFVAELISQPRVAKTIS